MMNRYALDGELFYPTTFQTLRRGFQCGYRAESASPGEPRHDPWPGCRGNPKRAFDSILRWTGIRF
jgi:hypothetical protein